MHFFLIWKLLKEQKQRLLFWRISNQFSRTVFPKLIEEYTMDNNLAGFAVGFINDFKV